MSEFLARRNLQRLIDQLTAMGYEVIGPTVQQNAIVLRPVQHVDQLPTGWSERQSAGSYRLEATGSERVFDFTIGPDAWKRYLFPPQKTLSGARLDDDGWHFETPTDPVPRYALLGVRACDLAAIQVQDRVFLHDDYVDPNYRAIRDEAILIAVNCSTSAPTCFCTSMGSGPECRSGFDLVLTEIADGFVIDSATAAGDEVVRQIGSVEASHEQVTAGRKQIEECESSISKRFETDDVRALLMNNLDHGHWQNVADRCLSCTNCTMVCPTCFCSGVEEVSDLNQTQVERVRHWDSCFNPEMSYTAGETIRPTIRSRYRQWLTHKLATWHDQFDTSGCVGCGRCITWCPVGIDLTEEVNAIRCSDSRNTEMDPQS